MSKRLKFRSTPAIVGVRVLMSYGGQSRRGGKSPVIETFRDSATLLPYRSLRVVTAVFRSDTIGSVLRSYIRLFTLFEPSNHNWIGAFICDPGPELMRLRHSPGAR